MTKLKQKLNLVCLYMTFTDTQFSVTGYSYDGFHCRQIIVNADDNAGAVDEMMMAMGLIIMLGRIVDYNHLLYNDIDSRRFFHAKPWIVMNRHVSF